MIYDIRFTRFFSRITHHGLLVFSLFAFSLSAFCGVLTPVVGYITDSQGNPYVGTNLTITAWPPTNAITGVTTNLVANLAITDTTGAGGFFSNNLAPGTYRLLIPGFTHGVIFGVVSNSTAINVAQVAGVPVTEFMNFTLAQFSDAGTMAYQSTNNWVANNYSAVSNAVQFAIATNGGPVAISQLPYTPPTNSYVALTNILGFIPATNGGPVGVAQLPYTPPTNTYAALTNILGFVPATNGGPVSTSQLPYQPATNNAAINNTQLTTNVLVSIPVAGPPASIVTNFGICWLVFYTNAAPATAFTNLPNGSFCSTTNGQFFVLSNLTWLVK